MQMKGWYRSQRGASLVEIIVALGVLAVGLYSIGSGLGSARDGAAVSLQAMKRETVAANLLEMLQASASEVKARLGSQPSVRIPQDGFNVWPGRESYRWAAIATTIPGKPAAQVEVMVYPAKGDADKPVASAVGLVPLPQGGAQ